MPLHIPTPILARKGWGGWRREESLRGLIRKCPRLANGLQTSANYDRPPRLGPRRLVFCREAAATWDQKREGANSSLSLLGRRAPLPVGDKPTLAPAVRWVINLRTNKSGLVAIAFG